MTDYEKMPDHDLRIEVAEKVMNWKLASVGGDNSGAVYWASHTHPGTLNVKIGAERAFTFAPCHSIKDAMRLVDTMQEHGFHFVLKSPFQLNGQWVVGFTPHDVTGWNGRADYGMNPATLYEVPRAIVITALQALDAKAAAQ